MRAEEGRERGVRGKGIEGAKEGEVRREGGRHKWRVMKNQVQETHFIYHKLCTCSYKVLLHSTDAIVLMTKTFTMCVAPV